MREDVMRKKKGLRYSYNNRDVRNSNFLNKNFNKTDSYHSNFSGAKFVNTSMIGAKFKFCAFYGTEFDSCYIRGALFRKANLRTAIFRTCIISASNFERCKFKDVMFENCKIIAAENIKKYASANSFIDVEFFYGYPAEKKFSPALIRIVKDLRRNDLIRRSTVLHRKRGKIDTVSLKMLVDTFGEDILISHLGRLPNMIMNEFYSLSYVVRALQKLTSGGTIDPPVLLPLALQNSTNDCSSTD